MLYLKLILYYQTVVSNISKKILEVSFFNFKWKHNKRLLHQTVWQHE